MNISGWFMVVVYVLMAVRIVHGRQIDIRKEVHNIISQHNKLRGDSQLMASDMLEMRWDPRLAGQAATYAERCIYQRPSLQEFDVGSNLYYEVGFVHDPKSIHKFVNSAFTTWTMHSRTFTFSSSCGSACPYIQMITSQTYQVGCAISTCNVMNTGSMQELFASLFVCFYAPRTNLMASVPFRNGFPCTQCPQGTICRYGLCTSPGYEAVPSYLEESFYNNSRRHNPHVVEDELSSTEIFYLTSGHNRMRENNNKDPVVWDPYLEKWAKWVVSCTADYPGPGHAYTNFVRLDQGEQVHNKLFEWSTEGDDVNLHLDRGCRTPFDNTRCNHFTNLRQPMLTSMACAAKDCKDGTRQLVCLYDNKVDRVYMRSGYTNNIHANDRYNRNRRLRNRIK